MLRFSLRTLGIAVGLIAISFAALLKASPWIANTAWTAVFVALATATIAAALASERRGFCTGFAIAGWLYVMVGIRPLSGYHNGSLLMTAALHRAAAVLSEQQVAANLDVAWSPTLATSSLTQLYASKITLTRSIIQPPLNEPAQSFVSIGQALWTLLLALLGGWFGSFIVAKRRRALASEGSHQR